MKILSPQRTFQTNQNSFLNYSQLEVAATIRTFTAEGGLADIFVNDKTIVVCVVCLMRARIDACKVFRRYD